MSNGPGLIDNRKPSDRFARAVAGGRQVLNHGAPGNYLAFQALH